MIDLIIPGDVVQHTSTRRVACVVQIGRTHSDGTIEYEVRPAQNRDGALDLDLRWWNSAHIRRMPRRDPYRRYLALAAREDDAASQARRQHPPNNARGRWRQRARYFGPWISSEVWENLYWKLSNTMCRDPSGARVWYNLGRESWERAALDCLERRDRAAHYGMQPRTGEGS